MTDGHKNNVLNDDPESLGVTLVSSTNSDGVLYCKFTREAKTTIQGVEYDLQKSKYNLLLAQGTCKFIFTSSITKTCTTF